MKLGAGRITPPPNAKPLWPSCPPAPRACPSGAAVVWGGWTAKALFHARLTAKPAAAPLGRCGSAQTFGQSGTHRVIGGGCGVLI